MTYGACLFQDLGRALQHSLLRAEQKARIKVALNGQIVANPLARFADGNAPIDAQAIRARSSHRLENRRAPIDVKNSRNACADRLKNLLRVRHREFFVISAGKISGPGVENLYDLCSGFDLKQQVLADRVCDLAEQIVKRPGLAIGHSLDLGKALRTSAFDHV